MKKLFLAIGMSLMLALVGTGTGYASSGERGHERQEQHKDKNNNHGNKGNKGHNSRPGNNGQRPGNNGQRPGNNGQRPGHSAPRPGAGARPTPPPRYNKHVSHHPSRLAPMVHNIGPSYRVTNVWQVNADTYLVRYLYGGRYYTRYIYPYANTYGNIQLVSNSWGPLSGWVSIPLGNLGNLTIGL